MSGHLLAAVLAFIGIVLLPVAAGAGTFVGTRRARIAATRQTSAGFATGAGAEIAPKMAPETAQSAGG